MKGNFPAILLIVADCVARAFNLEPVGIGLARIART